MESDDRCNFRGSFLTGVIEHVTVVTIPITVWRKAMPVITLYYSRYISYVIQCHDPSSGRVEADYWAIARSLLQSNAARMLWC